MGDDAIEARVLLSHEVLRGDGQGHDAARPAAVRAVGRPEGRRRRLRGKQPMPAGGRGEGALAAPDCGGAATGAGDTSSCPAREGAQTPSWRPAVPAGMGQADGQAVRPHAVGCGPTGAFSTGLGGRGEAASTPGQPQGEQPSDRLQRVQGGDAGNARAATDCERATEGAPLKKRRTLGTGAAGPGVATNASQGSSGSKEPGPVTSTGQDDRRSRS